MIVSITTLFAMVVSMQLLRFSQAFDIDSSGSRIRPRNALNIDTKRREILRESILLPSILAPVITPNTCQANAQETEAIANPNVFEIKDPNTYPAVVHIPPKAKQQTEPLPLLVLLHGAGNNQNSALYEFTFPGSSTSPPGDHTQLPLALLSVNQAPPSLSNFVIVAPYIGQNKPGSLYNEPRTKITSFIKWFQKWAQEEQNISINPQKISLFGFSEGATLAVELGTTRLFNALILASYGFTGTLPSLAVERLQGIPIWVFHSINDDVYNIKCSQRLVESLLTYQGMDVFDVGDMVKFTKLKPIEKSNVRNYDGGREHVRSALVASKSEEVYTWLLRQ